ncbi:MAG TPA: peptidylprolyl isomerase [Verrucomicrobiae bacterium]|nr:peptidylprolyl isomerase [Verrucomicrobiae bacterium]
MFNDRLTKCVALAVVAAGLTGSATAAEPAGANPSASAPARKTDSLFPDTVVAKGKGVQVMRSEVDEVMDGLKANAAAQGQVVGPEQESLIAPQILDRLIQIQVLLAKSTAADKTAGQEATAKRLDAIKTRAGSEEVLDRQLKAVGTTPEAFRRKLMDESTAEAVLERELNINATDDAIKKFYDDNPSKFEQPEMVRASHILLSTRDMTTGKDLTEEQKAAKHKLAEDLLKRARAGEDFAKLAKEYSEDPGSKDKGGEYTFARASADPQHAMVPEFETAAFSLKTNEVSDIVTTQFGYHIIKLNEKIPAKKLAFAKVAPDIKEYLKGQEMQKRQDELKGYIAKIKKEADVQILDDKLKMKPAPDAGAGENTSAKPAPTPNVKLR